MTDVTVVIPGYNHGKYIGSAISSVVQQVGVKTAIIVVDDGSVDDTELVVRRFPEVEYHYQENAGAHAAINRGISLAKTEFVAVLNDDDIYDPVHLNWALKSLILNNADLHLSRPLPFGSGPLLDKMHSHDRHGTWLISRYGPAVALLFTNWFVGTSAMVMRRDLWGRLGGFRDFRLAHDLDFSLRVLSDNRCTAQMNEAKTWWYRCHDNNTVSSIQQETMQMELRRIFQSLPAEIKLDLEKTGLSGALEKGWGISLNEVFV